MDSLHSALLVMTAQRVARGFIARRRLRAQREQEEEDNLAMLRQGSTAEAALSEARLQAAAVAASVVAPATATATPTSTTSATVTDVNNSSTAEVAAQDEADDGVDASSRDDDSLGMSDEDTDDIEDDDSDDDDDGGAAAETEQQRQRRRQQESDQRRQLPGGFSLMGAVTADHKRDLNVKTGLIRAVLAQRVARGFIARRRFTRLLTEASKQGQQPLKRGQQQEQQHEQRQGNAVEEKQQGTEADTPTHDAQALLSSPSGEQTVHGRDPGAVVVDDGNSDGGGSDRGVVDESGGEGEEEEEEEEEEKEAEMAAPTAAAAAAATAVPPPPPPSRPSPSTVDVAVRVQSIGRGFLARLRVRRQVEREQAENLALLHQGSQAEVALESGTLRYAQVVTAQRLVRGVLTRKRLAEAAERAEADTVATLQRGSEAERKVAAKRWQRLREERGRQEAAVCYMQALVRGHLTRRTTTHRHLPDDDGDFSEAEADDDEADDFF